MVWNIGKYTPCATTGIVESPERLLSGLYPNPVQNQLHLLIPEAFTKAPLRVNITDLLGNTCLPETTTNAPIDVSSLKEVFILSKFV